ncbi:MAG: peptidoglycan recognition family protein [Acidobacteriota bacterium]
MKYPVIAFAFLMLLFAADGAPVSAQDKIERPRIISRSDWAAKKPVGKGTKHKISFITIHHTATVQKPDVPIETKMRNLQAFSQRDDRLDTGKFKPAWFDIPYHYYIAADGQIAEGRSIEYAGDTNTEYDPTGHALIVVEGSFNKETPTAAQIASLKQIVAWLARKYKVPPANIKGHNDYAKTGCPGENLKVLFPEIKAGIQ